MEPFRTVSAGGSSSESLPPTPASGVHGQVCRVLHARVYLMQQACVRAACHFEKADHALMTVHAGLHTPSSDTHQRVRTIQPQSDGTSFMSTPAVVAPGTPLTPDERSELDHLRWLVSACDEWCQASWMAKCHVCGAAMLLLIALSACAWAGCLPHVCMCLACLRCLSVHGLCAVSTWPGCP